MKNFSILTLLAALLFVGCSDIFVELESPLTNETTLPDLTANFADDGLTRTYVEAGKYLRWHEADLITAFFGNTLNRQYKFNGATGANSGTFSLVPNGELGTGNTLDAIYAIYPYDASATISDEGLISLTLPSEQSYAESSFGKGANTMVAVTESVEDTFLSFKNACGYLKLYLYNVDGATLKSVSVKGNNNEKIAGAASVAMTFGDTPEVTMSDDATTAVTLDCGEGIALGTTSETATALWIVLPETTFEKGITITVTDTEGSIFEKSTSNSVAITRNDIQPMAALAVEFVAPVVKPANNEIWYTNGSTTEATSPYKTNVFGVNIVSNTYDAEKECWVIKFDGDVTTIGDNAFYNCRSITTITIPDNVTTIGSSAFSNCSGLTSITIPDSVTSIGSSAFLYCTGELIVNCNIPSASGYKYGAFYNSEFTSVTIGDSVTTIGDCAFYNCSSLTTITIPDSVTTIGDYAFRRCSSLTSVTIPDSVTSIGNSAFDDCSSLTSVTIGDDVTSIGSSAFSNCSSLTSVTIPNSVTTIENSAFFNCKSLTSVTIPDSVTSIGSSAFRGCSSLTTITIPDSVTSIGSSAFSECSGLIEFKGKFASEDGRCIIIEGELKSFAKSGLTEYTIPDSVTTIGDFAFNDCSSLTTITIPDSVTSIGSYAFYNCSKLTSVTIPDDVTFIGIYAFSRCFALTNVYCKPKTPPTSNDYMFYENASDRKIYVPINSVDAYKSNEYWGGWYGSAILGYNFAAMELSRPANNEIYYTNGSTTNATTPYKTNVFGANIVSNTYDAEKECWVIKFDGKVTKIGESAFNQCESLTSVTIPDSVTSIGDAAFILCTKLKSINIPDSVTTIGDSAFNRCDNLTSITIPNSVTTIKNTAFAGCYSLTSITIPNSVTTLNPQVFYNCTSLTSVTIPNSVITILNAFEGCDSLTTITIPDSVTTIGESAFSSCDNLTSVAIGNSVTSIGKNAFSYCSSLTSVYCKATTPPAGGSDMFYDNASGRTIYVPRNSVSAYKFASGWGSYASYIVEYDF